MNHPTRPIPTIGIAIRNMRLGFRVWDHANAWLRIQSVEGGFRVDLLPLDVAAKSRRTRSKHICWWDDPDILFESPALRRITNVKQPITLTLNDAGREWNEYPEAR